MSEEKDSPGGPEEREERDGEALPVQMQLFSTWEVRKVPANCVSRLCTLTVTRLEILRCVEAGLHSIVLAVSMKTPHRFLRSNEIQVPSTGTLDIPLQLTFSLQYPHFLKRGGNVLQLRLQRKKRYHRPIRGYKTLAIGKVDMSQVLQQGFQGKVALTSEKVTEPLANVTVGSLSSTAVDMEPRSNLAEGSSDEDEDDIFSDEALGQASDSDSGDNMEQPSYVVPPRKIKNLLKPSSAVLRLLRLNRPSKGGPVELMTELDLQEAVEDRESAVTFASSPSDSEEEDEELMGGDSPPRPLLSPFFGADRCSMVSLPTSGKTELEPAPHAASEVAPLLRRYGSLEQAITGGRERMESPTTVFSVGGDVGGMEGELRAGRVWVVDQECPSAKAVREGLEQLGESVMGVERREEVAASLQPLLVAVEQQWRDKPLYSIVLCGGDALVSAVLQALVSAQCSTDKLSFAVVPLAPGLVASRIATMDDRFRKAFPSDGHWVGLLQDSLETVLQFVQDATHTLQLPLGQVSLYRSPGDGGSPPSQDPTPLPFVCSVSVGELEPDSEATPISPTGSSSGGETQELVVEYWGGRKEGQKASVKVRSVMVSCTGQVLNVTGMSRDKKGKGIRIRKKEVDMGGSIVSLTATQLVCRPGTKQDAVTVVVDGVEWAGVSMARVASSWKHRTFPIAVAPTDDT